MIAHREYILRYGKEIRMRIAPVDPVDPFSGRYLILSFTDNTCVMPLEKTKQFTNNNKVYAQITVSPDGFAVINSITKEPSSEGLYIAATIDYINSNPKIDIQNTATAQKIAETKEPVIIHISFPFNRYYLNETTASSVEEKFRTVNQSWVSLKIRNGEGVISNLHIE